MSPQSAIPSLVFACLLAVSDPIWAVSTGVTSNSFLPNLLIGCNTCHGGGLGPTTVTIIGPTLVSPGSTNEYLVTIGTPLAAGGLNVNAAQGVLSTGGAEVAGTQVLTGVGGRNEITHSAPKATVGGTVSFSFLWTSPEEFESVELLAFGNAVNLDHDIGGDRGSASTITVASDSPVPPPPAPDLGPAVVDLNLFVETVVEGLDQPTTMAFLGADDFLILEKNTGRVHRIVSGVLQPAPVLDVPVNGAGIAGLLGIAVNTEIPPRVFLFYSEAEDPAGTGADGGVVLGHRLYRYTWNPSSEILEDPQLIVHFPPSPNSSTAHKGGIIVLGPPGVGTVGDGSLVYVIMGDNGTAEGPGNFPRQLNNQKDGTLPDDMSVIVRVEQDGTPAAGNPFVPYCSVTTSLACPSGTGCPGGETCLTQVEKYFAYGIRNSFGMAFDPATGYLWETENGPFLWDEINRVEAGFNNGWKTIHGPIDLDPSDPGNLFEMPGGGSMYSDPEFSWFEPVGVTSIVFPVGSTLGGPNDDVALVGDSVTGQIYRLLLDPTREGFDFTDFPLLDDLVANDQVEADLLGFGNGFGIVTDLKIGPDGHLYVVSLTAGAVLRIRPVCPETPGTPDCCLNGVCQVGADCGTLCLENLVCTDAGGPCECAVP